MNWIWIPFVSVGLLAVFIAYMFFLREQREISCVRILRQVFEGLSRAQIECWLDKHTLSTYLNTQPPLLIQLGCKYQDYKDIRNFLNIENLRVKSGHPRHLYVQDQVEIEFYDVKTSSQLHIFPLRRVRYMEIPVWVPNHRHREQQVTGLKNLIHMVTELAL